VACRGTLQHVPNPSPSDREAHGTEGSVSGIGGFDDQRLRRRSVAIKASVQLPGIAGHGEK
jgi:hypothetical protein